MSSDDVEEALARIERSLGTLYEGQRDLVRHALVENKHGVYRVMDHVLTSDRIDNPVAVFLARIKMGDHLREESGELERPSPREAFGRLFATKIEELRFATEWDDARCVEFALDYAVSYVDRCRIGPYPPGETALTLEDDMRRKLNRPRPVTTGDERKRMGLEWRVINACRYDERIGSMLMAMLEGCATPGEPTHDEARDCRPALMAEIVALGVEPRVAGAPAGAEPEEVEGWVTIGRAVDEYVERL